MITKGDHPRVSSVGIIPWIREMTDIVRSSGGEASRARAQRERQESIAAERATLTAVIDELNVKPLDRPRRRL